MNLWDETARIIADSVAETMRQGVSSVRPAMQTMARISDANLRGVTEGVMMEIDRTRLAPDIERNVTGSLGQFMMSEIHEALFEGVMQPEVRRLIDAAIRRELPHDRD